MTTAQKKISALINYTRTLLEIKIVFTYYRFFVAFDLLYFKFIDKIKKQHVLLTVVDVAVVVDDIDKLLFAMEYRYIMMKSELESKTNDTHSLLQVLQQRQSQLELKQQW